MKLLVDIGNSRIKWARETAAGLGHHGDALRQGPGFGALLDRYWQDMQAPEQILVSNVAGSKVADELASWTMARWECAPSYATVSRSACGVTNAYRDPAQLGIDRWLAMIAAWQKYREPVCIIDCGTALTVDAVDVEGRHLGGLIIPGLALMQESLSSRAPGIRSAGRPSTFSGLADNTADAVNSGCVTAIVAAIERITAMVREQSGPGVPCLLTGGDAGHLLPHISARGFGDGFRHEPHLVLEGLVMVFGGDSA